MRGAARLLALVATAACSFDPSGKGGGAGVPDAGSTPGAAGDAASGGIGGAGGADGAVAVAQQLTPFGPASTVGDLGGDGGSAFTAECADGRVVTGLDAEDNDFGLCRLRAVCSHLILGDGGVQVVDEDPTPMFGNETSYYDIDPVDCPTGSVLAAFDGTESGDGLVQNLRLWCAPVRWDGAAVSLGVAAPVANDIGSASGGSFGAGVCPPGQLAAGIAGRSGTILDRFELRCYQVTAVPH
jgi:hypothetical protein